MDPMQKKNSRVHSFSEHSLTVSGEREDLLDLVRYLLQVEISNTWADMIYKIKLSFDEEFYREVRGGADDAFHS